MPFQGEIFTFLAQNNSRSFCLLSFFTTLQGRSHIHTTMKKTVSFLDSGAWVSSYLGKTTDAF